MYSLCLPFKIINENETFVAIGNLTFEDQNTLDWQYYLFCFFFVALHPKSTAMVMAGGSVRWAL